MKKMFILLSVVLLLYLGITYFMSGLVLDTPNRSLAESYRIGTEQWRLNLDSLRAELPPVTEISFPSPVDGITLRGWYFRQAQPANCGIVLAHGYHDNRMSMLKYTPYFDRCGCDLLLYDHRGFGESDEAYATGGVNEALDLQAAHRQLASRSGLSDSQIGWLGESWGAATAVQAAAAAGPEPAFVIAESPYADWETAITERGVKDYGAALAYLTPGTFRWVGWRSEVDVTTASPEWAAAELNVPLLLFHSRQDTLTAPIQSDRIAARVRPDLLTYHALDWGAWHAHNVVWRPKEYEALLADFVNQSQPTYCNNPVSE
jgi:alpha-beta hydrolase superfamily lysophospholipase